MLIVIQERKKFSFSFFKKKEVALFIFSGSPNLDKILNETSRLICFENIVELRLGYFGPRRSVLNTALILILLSLQIAEFIFQVDL